LSFRFVASWAKLRTQQVRHIVSAHRELGLPQKLPARLRSLHSSKSGTPRGNPTSPRNDRSGSLRKERTDQQDDLRFGGEIAIRARALDDAVSSMKLILRSSPPFLGGTARESVQQALGVSVDRRLGGRITGRCQKIPRTSRGAAGEASRRSRKEKVK
jgi:hypothetical protein